MLKAFRRSNEWGVTDLASELGMPKSVAHRILRELAAGELLVQSESRGTYRLGPEVVRLGRAATQTSVVMAARPYLERLVHATQESSTLAILQGIRGVWMDHFEGPQHLRFAVSVGESFPLHAGACGKVMLAFQPEELVAKVLEAPMRRYTDTTITDPAQLRTHLEEIRRLGYATSDSEMSPGSRGVAAPVWGAKDTVVGAVMVMAPSDRLPDETLDAYRELVLDAASRASASLGATPREIDPDGTDGATSARLERA